MKLSTDNKQKENYNLQIYFKNIFIGTAALAGIFYFVYQYGKLAFNSAMVLAGKSLALQFLFVSTTVIFITMMVFICMTVILPVISRAYNQYINISSNKENEQTLNQLQNNVIAPSISKLPKSENTSPTSSGTPSTLAMAASFKSSFEHITVDDLSSGEDIAETTDQDQEIVAPETEIAKKIKINTLESSLSQNTDHLSPVVKNMTKNTAGTSGNDSSIISLAGLFATPKNAVENKTTKENTPKSSPSRNKDHVSPVVNNMTKNVSSTGGNDSGTIGLASLLAAQKNNNKPKRTPKKKKGKYAGKSSNHKR